MNKYLIWWVFIYRTFVPCNVIGEREKNVTISNSYRNDHVCSLKKTNRKMNAIANIKGQFRSFRVPIDCNGKNKYRNFDCASKINTFSERGPEQCNQFTHLIGTIDGYMIMIECHAATCRRQTGRRFDIFNARGCDSKSNTHTGQRCKWIRKFFSPSLRVILNGVHFNWNDKRS